MFSNIEVTYKSHMGTDEYVCDMARVSFKKLASGYTPEQNAKLLSYLSKHNHWTPFAHPQITLHVKVPIFVARQDFKHIVGFTRNEVSRRYVDDAPEFYNFEGQWRGKPTNGAKQGSDGIIEDEWDQHVIDLGYGEMCANAASMYHYMLSKGVAPEQARAVLPQSMMTEYYTTGSLAAWARMVKQRTDPHAQKEIQDLANLVSETIAPLFPVCWPLLTGQ